MELVLNKASTHTEIRAKHSSKRIKCLYKIQIQFIYKDKMPFIKT